jgi:hypothetical protein
VGDDEAHLLVKGARDARWTRRSKLIVAAMAATLAAAIAAAVLIMVIPHPGSGGSAPGANSGKVCPVAGTTADSTAGIQAAIRDCAGRGTVSIAAGV